MRAIMLFIATVVMLYIAYTLERYTTRLARHPVELPTLAAVDDSSANNTAQPRAELAASPTVEPPLEISAGQKLADEKAALKRRQQELEEWIKQRDERGFEEGLKYLLHENDDAQIRKLLVRTFPQQLSVNLHFYTQLNEHSESVVLRALQIALVDGHGDLLLMVEEKLRSADAVERKLAVAAIATMQPQEVRPAMASTLAPHLLDLFQAADEPSAEIVSALEILQPKLQASEQQAIASLLAARKEQLRQSKEAEQIKAPVNVPEP